MAEDTVMPPVHPGEILQEEFLAPLGVSQYQLAKAAGSSGGRGFSLLDAGPVPVPRAALRGITRDPGAFG